MTKKPRTPRTAAFKKKISLETIREDKTLLSQLLLQKRPVKLSEMQLMRRVDEIYTARPFLGSRKIA